MQPGKRASCSSLKLLDTTISEGPASGPNSRKVRPVLFSCIGVPSDIFLDYIEGLGDTASFVIVGAGHDKERGRQLGVGPQVWTTFYVGLQTNRSIISSHVRHVQGLMLSLTVVQPSTQPDYHILFSVSWGLDRAQLDYVNDYAKRTSGHRPLATVRLCCCF